MRAKDDGRFDGLGREEALKRLGLEALGHHHGALGDMTGAERLTLDLHGERVPEMLLGDGLDAIGHRRAEERYLPRIGRLAEDGLHVLEKAHAEHLIGLVEHDHLEGAQVQRAPLEVVEDAARCPHDHGYALAQRRELRAVGGAAVDRDDADGEARREAANGVGDLERELARRRQHEPPHVPSPLVLYPFEQRQTEGGGLAGARARSADDVAAGEKRGERLRLDRRRRLEAEGAEGFDEAGVEPKGVESGR